MHTLKKNSLLIFCHIFIAFSLFAQEGVQFEAAQISINSPCNPVIFKGTQRSDYAQTAFLMPRLQVAKTTRGTSALEFVELSNGKRVLQLGLYFPKFSIRNRSISYENFSTAECNYQQILNAINHQNPQAKKTTRIVTLQIKNIGIEIDGIEGITWVSNSQTSILSYEGQIKKVEIPLSDDVMKDTISRLTSDIGFNINVHFQFLARKSNGYHQINIDYSNVADEFKTIVSAQASVPMPKLKLSSVEASTALGIALASSVSNLNGDYYSEEGTNEVFNNLGRNIFKSIMQQISSDISGSSTSLSENEGSQATRKEPCYPSISDCPDNDDLPEIPKAKHCDGDCINAQAFYQKLRQQQNISLKLENNSQVAAEVYTTSLLIKRDEEEDQRFQISLSSESAAKNSRFKMNQGDEILIYPQAEEAHHISYRAQTTNYSASNLNDPVGFKHFSKLNQLSLKKLIDQETTGGSIAYMKESRTHWIKNPLSFFNTPVYVQSRYSWGKIVYHSQNSQMINKSYAELLAAPQELIEALSLGFIFNKRSPNRIYTLQDLFEISGSFLDIYYDHDRYAYVLKANENLGSLRLKNLKPTKTKLFAPEQHFQDVQTKTMLQSFKGKKKVRTFSSHDQKKEMPIVIFKQILKIEKVNPFDKLGEPIFEIPVSVSPN